MLQPSSIYVQVEPGKPGAEVSRGETTINQKKTLPIECAQRDQPFHGGDVACFDVMRLVAG